MLRVALLACTILHCLFPDQVWSERFPRDFGRADLFHASEVDGRFLTKEALVNKYGSKSTSPFRKPDDAFSPVYQKLDHFLLSRTKSEDPNINLDFILDKLVAGYKNKVLSDDEANKGERLVLALRSLKGDDECGYYSQIVLLNNFYASELDVISIKNRRGLRRIDRILIHYIKQHINNCREVYFKKFDELSKELDVTQMKHLDRLFRKAIEKLTSDSRLYNQGRSYVERLYNVASEKTLATFDLDPQYIYDSLKDLMKGDPDEKFLKPVRSTRSKRVRWDKFNRVYEDYIVQPCHNLRQTLGPELFEPLFFDSMFEHEIQRRRVDFYEVWLKYRLCHFNGSARDSMDNVIEFANNL